MIQLLITISHLPSLGLDECESDVIAARLQSMQTLTKEQWEASLQHTALPISLESQAQFTTYLNAYFSLSEALLNFIATVTQRINASRGVADGATDVLPLLVELMPQNIDKLARLIKRLTTLKEFAEFIKSNKSTAHFQEVNYYFNMLLSASVYKFNAIKRRDAGHPEEEGFELSNKLAIQLRDEDRLQRRLEALKTIALQYKDELTECFMQQLIADENPLYLSYFQGEFANEPEEERMTALFEAVTQRREIFSQELLNTANRVIAIRNICRDLQQDGHLAHRAAAFKRSFERYHGLFESHTLPPPRGFFQLIRRFLCCFNLMSQRTKNNQLFLRKGGFFSAYGDKKSSSPSAQLKASTWMKRIG